MSSRPHKDDDYYPLRWKFADAVENIIILYQTKAAIAVAAFGLVFVIVGLLLLGWRPFGSDADEAVSQDPARELSEPQDLSIDPDSVRRTVATDEQVATTKSGAVIELGPRTIRIVGGAASDEAADANAAVTLNLFPGREILDDQLLSQAFGTNNEITVRVVEPGFFLGEGAELNSELISLISDVAEAVRRNDAGNAVLVVGHAPTGPLGTERAESVANELINLGLTIEQVSFTSVGNSEPLPGVESYIEFLLR